MRPMSSGLKSPRAGWVSVRMKLSTAQHSTAGGERGHDETEGTEGGDQLQALGREAESLEGLLTHALADETALGHGSKQGMAFLAQVRNRTVHHLGDRLEAGTGVGGHPLDPAVLQQVDDAQIGQHRDRQLGQTGVDGRDRQGAGQHQAQLAQKTVTLLVDLAGGDVGDHPDDPSDPPAPVMDRKAAVLHPANGAVGMDHPVFGLGRLVGQLLFQGPAHPSDVVGMNRLQERARVGVGALAAPSPEGLVGRADVVHPELDRVEDPEHRVQVVDQLAKAAVGLEDLVERSTVTLARVPHDPPVSALP